MTELLTAAQMRAIEQAAIESGQVTGLELMERAGQGVVEAIFEEWPELAGDRPEGTHEADATEGGLAPRPAATPQSISETLKAVVLCGPGNNGGDGFVVARLLAARGWAVEVFLYGDPGKLPPDARVNYERWCESGSVEELEVFQGRKSWGCDLIIDALFGTGLRRALRPLADLFWNLEDMVDCFGVEPGHPLGRPAIVAVDIPSGVCADSGRDFPHEADWHRFSAAAHLTVTFHAAKLGHFLSDGAGQCGKLKVVDIGLEDSKKTVDWIARLPAEEGVAPKEPNWRRVQKSVVERIQATHPSWLNKGASSHKFSHGHALVLTGGSGKTGAARLAARGALRIGAGLVTLGVPPSAQMEVAAQITALMLTRVPDAAGLAEVLEDGRINALCLGPGLGLARARDLVPVALAAARPTVLDADALSAYAEDPEALFAMLHERCVLTPHGGEFARLFPDINAKLQAPATKGPAYSKVDATRAAAKRAGCTVLFKGADTVIADPSGQCSVHAASYERSAPWLATAGAGDVLAGFITGLLARGFAPHQAAATAAYLHVDCARSFGPGLIAEDLPEQLPRVLNDLLAKEV
ncbi:MAG: NAD(P)H-hydrate dehydratase [Pseudomonadota bacterium]|nr:NAD(P)H-hydrate dehydratase [Pseudomonadota bacterium]MEC8292114.1 NAD(P)H-hydrate dehydratase [Pseudomonadota bacterium]